MDGKDIEQLITSLLKPQCFKKRGRNWFLKGKEVTEVVTLQKSHYGNLYYFHHGLILNEVPLDGLVSHTAVCWYMTDDDAQELSRLLNLENGVADSERRFLLKDKLATFFSKNVNTVTTKEKFLEVILHQPVIPKVIQDYMGHL